MKLRIVKCMAFDSCPAYKKAIVFDGALGDLEKI